MPCFRSRVWFFLPFDLKSCDDGIRSAYLSTSVTMVAIEFVFQAWVVLSDTADVVVVLEGDGMDACHK